MKMNENVFNAFRKLLGIIDVLTKMSALPIK